jgi:putative redox protein
VERVRFAGSTGATLAGLLDRPLDEPRAWAVFAHCFTCSKDAKAAYRVGRTLAERGIAMLRFDVTGLGESEGDFTATDFRTNVEDVVAAAEFLGRTRTAPALLVGHSLGGAACLAAAPRLAAVRLVATIATPSDTASLRARILPFAHAERIFAAARQPKGLLALPGAGHLLSDERDARFVGEVLAAWVERW